MAAPGLHHACPAGQDDQCQARQEPGGPKRQGSRGDRTVWLLSCRNLHATGCSQEAGAFSPYKSRQQNLGPGSIPPHLLLPDVSGLPVSPCTQIFRLMRTLVELCGTLEEVPEERHIFMRLTYHVRLLAAQPKFAGGKVRRRC